MEGSLPHVEVSKLPQTPKVEKKKSNTKKTVIIVLAILFIACALCAAAIGFLTWKAASDAKKKEESRSIYQKVGVIEYSALYENGGINTDTKEEQVGEVKIMYTTSSEDEKEIVKSLLQSKPIAEKIQNSKGITIVIDTSMTKLHLEDVIKSGPEVLVAPGYLFFSGNYIYITSNAKLNDGHAFYQELLSGIVYAEMFNEFTNEDIQAFITNKEEYDFSKIDLMQEYIKVAGITETESTWQHPNNNLLSQYRSAVEICSTDAPISVLACEVVVYESGNKSKLPDNISTFLTKNMKVVENGEFTALNTFPAGQNDKYPGSAKLSISPIKYNDWDIGTFTDTKFKQISNSKVYHKVSVAQLEKLKTTIEKDGWRFIKKSAAVKSKKFGAVQQNWIFQKEGNLIKSELIIRTMNTSGLTSDCIVQGFAVFCDSKSIYKNSGYVLEVLVGEYTKAD